MAQPLVRQPLLRISGIRKSFRGVQALKGVDLELYAGEALAFIGANGAGKSTLMNILGGVVMADEGELFWEGVRIAVRSPLAATANGIAFVHQEMALLPTMTVAENMHIASFPTRLGLIDFRTMEEDCARTLSRFAAGIDSRTRVRDLSPGERQMVEIARALLGQARLIIFDEPTSSLTSREKLRLFDVIRSLKKEGVCVIYITHLLDEVFEVCDRAVVLRDGEVAGRGDLGSLTRDDIVRLMIGDKDTTRPREVGAARGGEEVLRVERLSRRGVLHDVNFTLRKGEVLGLWGLLGSGRTELARACAGLDPIDQGRIQVRAGTAMKTVQPWEARNWIGMITENRREEGLLLPMPVRANMSLANLRALVSRFWPFLDRRREVGLVKELVERLDIAVSSIEQPVETLSGGNQQKVVVGRWLQRNPPIYIMDEPTRGLDVGAKAEIRNIILELATGGAAILLISSDIEELTGLSDRYLVMSRGRLVAGYSAGTSTAELMARAAGVR